MFCEKENLLYICIRRDEQVITFGPFVYRLGRQVFILVRGVRFPYGLLARKVLTISTLRGCNFLGPFVYRLGRQVFILVRGVRFPYGLQRLFWFQNSLFLLKRNTFILSIHSFSFPPIILS